MELSGNGERKYANLDTKTTTAAVAATIKQNILGAVL